ncbi:type II toxin-antitoxin system VapC family toxin [Luteimicrobium sp. DT211]|uniref:type II toxin-antitoxin system VapC family toxin n=1 Tax=Luteimicrobium sp. DT211 TaxID=3393412 RepID=UPI003CE6B18C
MTTAYLDTSALVRLVRREPGSELAAALWNRAPIVATSRTSDVELRAVLAAGARRGLLSDDEHAAALDAWSHLWPSLYLVEMTRAVADRAAELVTVHPLRGGDAVHLASALLLAPDVVVAVWDEHVAAAAEAEGLTVLPGRYAAHERHAPRAASRRAAGGS